MLIERGVVKVGFEIEIPAWTGGRTFQLVCADLIEAEFMLGTPQLWFSHHKYHCACREGGCYEVRRGDLIVPPLVSMTYDASLPKTGAEFIISPILLAEEGIRSHLEDIWTIVVKDAVWTDKLDDYNQTGQKSSPSIHMHISATQSGDANVHYIPTDLTHALSLFSPELFLLADSAGVRRGLKFRLPTREAINWDGNPHHGFIDVKKVTSTMVYIEWRMFEAAYNDWDYVESSTYLAAALTRALLNPATLSTLMSLGYATPYDNTLTMAAVVANATKAFLEQVSGQRLQVLRKLCLTELDDDPYGRGIVAELFDRAERKL